MNAKESTKKALKHLKKTIETEGSIHLARIVRKHLSENPRIEESLPTFKTLVKNKLAAWRIEKKQLGLGNAYQQEKNKLKSKISLSLLQLNTSYLQFSDEVKNQPKIQTALTSLFHVAGFQWGALLPPRNLKLQHHKIEQHFILFRRVPVFIADVSVEWWHFMIEQALRKCSNEEETKVLSALKTVVWEFQKGFEKGIDLHTYLQQAFSLKNEVTTSKDLSIPLDPFSFQLFERFFSSLLNSQRGSE